MARRVWRWLLFEGALSLLPLGLAYGVRFYYAPSTPPVSVVLATGDGCIVAVLWSATALVELTGSPRARRVWSLLAIAVLLVSAVAYACLSADSVTGRVQTGRQEDIVTVGTVGVLVLAMLVGLAATIVTGGTTREERHGVLRPRDPDLAGR